MYKEESTTADEPKIKKNPKGGWDVVLANGKLYHHCDTMADAKKYLVQADVEENKKEASNKMFS